MIKQSTPTPLTAGPADAIAPLRPDGLSPAVPGTVAFHGWLGDRIAECIDQRVSAQSLEPILKPFRERLEHDGSGWRCEYWGKWMTSAVLAAGIHPGEPVLDIVKRGAAGLLATQDPDGYIGTYTPDTRLGIWDVWGRKYVLLGLLAVHGLTGDTAVLDAARRVADHLIAEVSHAGVRLPDTGIDVLTGLAPSSILEPMVLLYRRTGDGRYLEFARNLVAQWSQPGHFLDSGLQLVEGALEGVEPRRLGGAPKAYEMMSCFEGIVELHRSTGDDRLRDAAVRFAEAVAGTERTVVGSASNQELWCDGVARQTELWEQPQETCVTVTWMKLCFQLLRLTGDPRWADELERSLWNALPAAMMPGGRWWAYWCPLQGERIASEAQHADVGLSCCVANGPRGLLLTGQWAVMSGPEGPVVNLFAPCDADVVFPGGQAARIEVRSGYPVDGRVEIRVRAAAPFEGTLHLRIPSWSEETIANVSGETLPATAGTYLRIERHWNDRDTVVVELDMRGRIHPAPSGAPQSAVSRGPLVLALDNRVAPFTEPSLADKAVWLVGNGDGTLDLEPIAPPPGVHAAFWSRMAIRPSHFFNHHEIDVVLVDFASAGNAWSEDNLFRTWIAQPIHLRHAFPRDTWRLMAPRSAQRPQAPADSQEAPCVPTSFS